MSGLKFPDTAIMFHDQDQLEQAKSSMVACVKSIFKNIGEEEEEGDQVSIKAAGNDDDILMDHQANNEEEEEDDLFAPSADEASADPKGNESQVSEDNIF